MPRKLRVEQFVAGEICVVHTIQRCVRRAFLAGQDPVSGKNYDNRRDWIRRRLEILAAVYGVDVLSYAILSNHMHLILRNRPDVVASWSDHQAATRWLKLYPGRRLEEHLGQPSDSDIQSLLRDRERLARVRLRLSDISWFMRSLCEPIARMANRQDDCTGHFWEGRFKAQRITDESGLLACSMYVDLNPIRAALATSLEQSRHTSAYERIGGIKGERVRSAASELVALSPSGDRESSAAVVGGGVGGRSGSGKSPSAGRRILRDGWLSPLKLNERLDPGPQSSTSGVRASDKGFLTIGLGDYLRLLEWTARHGRSGTGSKPPAKLDTILGRLGIDSQMWCELVWNFKRYYGRVAGSPSSLQAEAARSDRAWIRGQRAVSECFTSG